jgi:8-oxo-dGTP pyrophosphatase MutT (NUDIX family)
MMEDAPDETAPPSGHSTLSPRPIDEMTPPADPTINWRQSAVLLLIYPRAHRDYIVFMRRTDTVEHHKGQISLPGGAQDPDDPDVIYTALREAYEELGIEPHNVEVKGVLPPVYARVSSFIIHPVVGRLRTGLNVPVFRPNPDEVAEVIEVPVAALQADGVHRVEQRTHQGATYLVHYYDYGPYEIWGATGRVLSEFFNRPDLNLH